MPSVEAKDELVQVSIELIGFDGSVMSAKDPAFDQRRNAMDARQCDMRW